MTRRGRSKTKTEQKKKKKWKVKFVSAFFRRIFGHPVIAPRCANAMQLIGLTITGWILFINLDLTNYISGNVAFKVVTRYERK